MTEVATPKKKRRAPRLDFFRGVCPMISRLNGSIVDALRQLGKHSLAVFMLGLVLAFAVIIPLSYWERGLLAVAAVNLGGIALLVFVARQVAWFKSIPWNTNAPASTACNSRGTDQKQISRASRTAH